MPDVEPRRHPLFDPNSPYGRMRDSVCSADKMSGYFHWMNARARRAGLSPASPRGQELAALAVRLQAEAPGVGDALPIDAHVVILSGRLRSFPLGGYLVLFHGPDAFAYVGLILSREGRDVSALLPGQACRALLLEPEVVARLGQALKEAEPKARDLLRAFDAQVMTRNEDLTRILSAAPDLEGQVEATGFRFLPLPLPAGFDRFPGRSEPLVVFVLVDRPTAG